MDGPIRFRSSWVALSRSGMSIIVTRDEGAGHLRATSAFGWCVKYDQPTVGVEMKLSRSCIVCVARTQPRQAITGEDQ